MFTEISAGFGSIKAAKEIIQALNGIQTAAAINDVKLTLQGHLLDTQGSLLAAQEAQTAASHRIAELEQEIVSLKDWEREKQRYELKDSGQGSFAYILKTGMENGEPTHWLCPACYQNRKKSIMKHEMIPIGRARTLVCHPCGMDIVIQGVRQQQPRVAASGRGSR